MRTDANQTNDQRTERILLAAAIIAVLVLGAASPALAHILHNSAWMHREAYLCVHNYTELSHGNGNGYAAVHIETHKEASTAAGTFSCFVNTKLAPGNIQGRITYYRLVDGKYAECATTGTRYNQTTTHEFRIKRTAETKPWCGNGRYRVRGSAYARVGSTADWKGGPLSLKSGEYHTLPTTTASSLAQSLGDDRNVAGGRGGHETEDGPEWVNPDGTFDLDAAPKYVPVLDEEGNLARCDDGALAGTPFEPESIGHEVLVKDQSGRAKAKTKNKVVEDGVEVDEGGGVLIYDIESLCERYPRVED